MSKTLVYTNDLFWKVRIQDVARGLGREIYFIQQHSHWRDLLSAESKSLIVDLSQGETAFTMIQHARETAPQIKIIAFVEHVRRDLIEQARAMGVDKVLARSAFTERLGELFSQLEE